MVSFTFLQKSLKSLASAQERFSQDHPIPVFFKTPYTQIIKAVKKLAEDSRKFKAEKDFVVALSQYMHFGAKILSIAREKGISPEKLLPHAKDFFDWSHNIVRGSEEKENQATRQKQNV